LLSLRLPQPPNALIGREREVTRACDRMLHHTGRLLTLVGPPGVGKTRLGLAVAARLGASLADGVCFVPLAGITDPAFVAPAVLAALGVEENSRRQQAPQSRLIEFLRRKEMLLLLDNLEQVLTAAPLLAEWLAECPRLHLLVTSRAALHLRAEQRMYVEPLAPEAAVELFVQRAQLVDPEFVLTEANGPSLEALCRRLDYLPLAIELIAARTDLLGVPALLARLKMGSLDLLAGDTQDLPARQRTLRQAIGQSYALLGDEERRLFRALGIFAGSFGLDAVHVYGADEPMLQRLLQMSLVHSETDERGNRRFRLLETLREFALEQLAANSELADAQRWHAEYCLALAEEAELHNWGEEQKVWLDRLEQNHDNLRAALAWVLANGEVELALRLASALCWFWGCRGYYEDRHRWLKQALVLAEQSWEFSPDIQKPLFDVALRRQVDVLANALLVEGGIIESDYDYAAAAVLLEGSLALDTLTGPKLTTVRIYHMLAWLAVKQGDYARGECWGNQALQLVHTLPHLEEGERHRMLAYVLEQLSSNALMKAEFTRSEQLAQQAKALFAALGDERYIAYTQINLGRAALYSGDYARAHRTLMSSLAQLREVGDIDGTARNLYEVGVLALRRGDLSQAQQAFREGLASMRYSGYLRRFVYQLRGLAEVARQRGRYVVAAQLLGALEMLRQTAKAPLPPLYALDFEATGTGVRSQLDDAAFAAAYASGYALTPDEAVAFALTADLG
jgi:predicted ATPase